MTLKNHPYLDRPYRTETQALADIAVERQSLGVSTPACRRSACRAPIICGARGECCDYEFPPVRDYTAEQAIGEPCRVFRCKDIPYCTDRGGCCEDEIAQLEVTS